MDFPSLKSQQLLAVLTRKPLAYAVVTHGNGNAGGSHRVLESPNGYPRIGFSWHDGVEVGGVMVRKVLVKQVGLSEQDALAAARGKLK